VVVTVEGAPWTPEAINRARIAELIVVCPGGMVRRGSGYRVGTEAVLTAAHVVDGADLVQVRFEPDLPGEWLITARSWWVHPCLDLAVVSITPRLDEGPLLAARFGRISNRSAVLSVQTVGFPRWKLRNYDGTVSTDDGRPRYRDAHHATGSVAILSNWRQGILEVSVTPPAEDPTREVSAWEGMSGAALWVGDRIIGVVAEHHPSDGLGRLAATRLDLALERLGIGQQDELCALLSLPKHFGQLPDVVPSAAGELTTTAYQAQLSDIAPEQLHDRDAELADLVQFCAGDQPYAWWQAGPWAGKSALLSWFVLHPPAGVDVVSFFVTGRFSGQSDSDAFTDALIEQLAALTGEAPAAVLGARSRRGHSLRLLEAVARRSQEAGRRLVLVVDGLDEDVSAATDAVRPSIAALLPRRLPPQVRVLVASRPHPPLPSDVPGDHPLRMVSPRPLTPSPHALDLQIGAKNELGRLLKGAEFQRDVLGLITASGGGLTQHGLEELTGRPPYEIDDLLGGLFGRSVGGRVSPTPAVGRPAERVYLFTHETLRAVAEEQYGESLARYRGRLHAWATDYQGRGWPAETPLYLLRGYPRLLAATGDLGRLLGCATDRARHDRMLDLTGGDALAVTEISTATTLITQQPIPDLGALLLLAVARDHLTERNSRIPAELPAVWITLGHSARATALVNGVTNPETRVRALTSMVRAAIKAGDQDSAERLAVVAEQHARTIIDLGSRVEALAWLIGIAGNHDRADRLATTAEQHARAITDVGSQAHALTELTGAVAVAGDQDRAEQLASLAEQHARDIVDPDLRAEVLAGLVRVSNDHDRAERLAQEITDPWWRTHALVGLVRTVATAGDRDRAERLATAAEQEARRITDPGWRARALTDLAVTTSNRDHAERLAQKITDSGWRARALTGLVETAATAGYHDHAEQLATAAEQHARTIADPWWRVRLLAGLVEAVTKAGDYDHGERLATAAEQHTRTIADPWWRAHALTELATAVAAAGDHHHAERLATAAEQHARNIIDPNARTQTLTRVVEAITAAGDQGRAERLATAAEQHARKISDPWRQADALITLARAVAAAGDHDHAEQLAGEITNPGWRAQAMTELIRAVAAAGDQERAERLANTAERCVWEITDVQWRTRIMTDLIQAIVAAGDHDHAKRVALKITNLKLRAEALTRLIRAAAATGNHDHAKRLATTTQQLVWHITDAKAWRPTAFVDTGIIPRTAIPCQILDTSCVQPRTV
jgi:Trypsin-like peptidase domain/NACHT domain